MVYFRDCRKKGRGGSDKIFALRAGMYCDIARQHGTRSIDDVWEDRWAMSKKNALISRVCMILLYVFFHLIHFLSYFPYLLNMKA